METGKGGPDPDEGRPGAKCRCLGIVSESTSGKRAFRKMVFNLSHSGHYVLCSIADTETARTGCDLEKTGIPRLKVARRFFCRSEWDYIQKKVSEDERKEAFYRYWVLKESFMKATRLGMKLPLDAFAIRLSEGEDPVLTKSRIR